MQTAATTQRLPTLKEHGRAHAFSNFSVYSLASLPATIVDGSAGLSEGFSRE